MNHGKYRFPVGIFSFSIREESVLRSKFAAIQTYERRFSGHTKREQGVIGMLP